MYNLNSTKLKTNKFKQEISDTLPSSGSLTLSWCRLDSVIGLTNDVPYTSATYVKNKVSVTKVMLAYGLDKNARYQYRYVINIPVEVSIY